MAFSLHGGVISIDNAGGTPTDVSAFIQDLEITEERATANHHNLSSIYPGATRGGITYSMTMQIIKTTGAAEAYKLLKARNITTGNTNGALTVTADTPDSSSGSERATGEWVFGGFAPTTKRTAGSGEAEIVTAKFIADGAITFSTL